MNKVRVFFKYRYIVALNVFKNIFFDIKYFQSNGTIYNQIIKINEIAMIRQALLWVVLLGKISDFYMIS